MAGPPWTDDQPADSPRIVNNCRTVITQILKDAPFRLTPDLDKARRWHDDIYSGVTVPSLEYVGHFRGDPNYPDLLDYEVGVGPTLPDGLPDRVGIPAALIAPNLDRFITSLRDATTHLDAAIPFGQAPATQAELQSVVTLAAYAHGDWVRIHPFANSNGRTARVWANWVAIRYGLRPFVHLKPRPADSTYARAARESMGRPPSFTGNHAPTVGLFASMLAASTP